MKNFHLIKVVVHQKTLPQNITHIRANFFSSFVNLLELFTIWLLSLKVMQSAAVINNIGMECVPILEFSFKNWNYFFQ